MKRKILITLTVLFALTASVFLESRLNNRLMSSPTILSHSANQRSSNSGELLEQATLPPPEPPSGQDNSNLRSLLDSLKDSDLTKRNAAKALILERATTSPAERQLVIDSLLQELASYTDFSQIRLPEGRDPWENMVNILGELRATEALPYFVKRLDWGVIYSESHSGYRAFQAVVKLGKDAVPALSVSISDPSPQIRFYSARALLTIEGEEAIRALHSAFEAEPDQNIRGIIGEGLAALHSKKPD